MPVLLLATWYPFSTSLVPLSTCFFALGQTSLRDFMYGEANRVITICPVNSNKEIPLFVLRYKFQKAIQTESEQRPSQSVAWATMVSYFVQKPRPSDFNRLLLFVPLFQHSHMTRHQILHRPSGSPFSQKPSLWQQ